MNPTNYEQPGLSLPEPLGSGTSTSTDPERGPVVSGEFDPTSATQAPAMPMAPVPSLGTAVPPQATTPPAVPTSSLSSPALADDADLIEKEWVTKAKAIVARTKNDPHEQSREMNYFKADYLKKRYNKDVKVSES